MKAWDGRHSNPGLRRATLLWAAGFAVVVGFHLLWALLDRSPPAWDMAHHQEQGWRVVRAWQQGELWSRLPSLSPYYPPLYYLQEALVIGLGSPARLLALGANLTGLAMLSFFTFRWAALRLGFDAAVAAGWLVVLLPMVVWVSRESLLDVSLAGWVAAALYLMARRHLNESGHWALLLGLVLAAGQLTKWTFVLFVAAPAVWVVYRSSDRRQSLRNLLTAALVAAPLVFYWMLPNLHFLLGARLEMTTAQNLVREAPAVLSTAGLTYYLRSLLSYYLMAPLFGMLLLGWLRYRRRPRWVLPWLALVSGGLLLSLLFIKDPRYALPLAAPLAILLVAPWRNHRNGLRWLVGLAAVQALVVSFPVTPGFKLSFGGRTPDPDYLNLTHEWVLVASDYHGVMGRPARQQWPLESLIESLGAGGRVAFAPEKAHLHSGLLTLAAVRSRLPLEVYRVGIDPDWPRNLRESEWLVGATGPQGITYLTAYNEDVYRAVREAGWPLKREWDLPDGTRLRLWRNPTPSR